MDRRLRVLFEGGRYLESPRWCDGRLWVSDTLATKVLNVGDDGAVEIRCELDDLPSGLAFLPGGQVIVVSMLQRRIVLARPGGATPYADLGGIAAGTLNDMIADTEGRVWIGDLGFDLLESPRARAGRLLLVKPTGETTVAAEELDYPNGIALTADGRRGVGGAVRGGGIRARRPRRRARARADRCRRLSRGRVRSRRRGSPHALLPLRAYDWRGAPHGSVFGRGRRSVSRRSRRRSTLTRA